jgi:hypothetical protein
MESVPRDLDQVQQRPTPFMKAIAAQQARAEHLHLTCTLHDLGFIDREGPLLLLRSLALMIVDRWNWGGSVPTVAFLNAPLLRKVALPHYYDLHFGILPWAQLTVLIVDWIADTECAAILNLAVNLFYCKLTVYTKEQSTYVQIHCNRF